MMIHMSVSVDRAVEFDPRNAATYMAKSHGVRYGIVILTAVVCYLTGWINMVSFALGLLLLKPSVYLQLLVRRIRRGAEPDEDVSSVTDWPEEKDAYDSYGGGYGDDEEDE